MFLLYRSVRRPAQHLGHHDAQYRRNDRDRYRPLKESPEQRSDTVREMFTTLYSRGDGRLALFFVTFSPCKIEYFF